MNLNIDQIRSNYNTMLLAMDTFMDILCDNDLQALYRVVLKSYSSIRAHFEIFEERFDKMKINKELDMVYNTYEATISMLEDLIDVLEDNELNSEYVSEACDSVKQSFGIFNRRFNNEDA